MAEQHRIGRAIDDFDDEPVERHGPELAVDQYDPVPVVDQRPAHAQQAEWRQLLLGNAAADRRVRYVDEKDAHA